MKTFLRMVGFVIIGDLVSSLVVGVIVVAIMQPLPTDIQMRAAQGDRASELRVAVYSEKLTNVINIALWSSVVGTVYGLEWLWRSRRSQPVKRMRLPGLLRWLGAGAGGFVASLWVYSAYSLLLLLTLPEHYLTQPATYARELADFGQQLEARGIISFLVWVVAAVLLGWLSSRPADTQPGAISQSQTSLQEGGSK
jgi:hypothetical protein